MVGVESRGQGGVLQTDSEGDCSWLCTVETLGSKPRLVNRRAFPTGPSRPQGGCRNHGPGHSVERTKH